MKRVLNILLILILLLLHCSNTLGVVTDSDNGKMKYYKKEYHLFDIKGYVNGELQSTTFLDDGYCTRLKVDDNEVEEMEFKDYQEQNINGISWDIDCSFINNGRYVKVTYILTNNNEQDSTISLGTYVDVQIAGNDRATIERFENSNGLKLYDTISNIQFSFYGKSVAGTTDIDNLWIGKWRGNDNGTSYSEHCFDNNSTNKIEEQDSAFTFSWVNRKIEAGETKRFSVIIGMGEVSNAPKIELDRNQGKCFSQDSIIINGTISDLDANSKATLYYVIDDGTEKNTEEKSLTNNKLDFNLDLTNENLDIGTHKIKLWAIDESGNPSEVLEKNILITNLKAPTLNMSEEWSKEAVKFTITDTQNDANDILKYQYKIGNGEWQDTELETEVLALENTGTITVMVKAVGKEPDEQSSIVSKKAKVDKNGPTIVITEQDEKIIIATEDEQSGIGDTRFILTTTKELTSENIFMEYKEPIECINLDSGDLYLHIIAKDKLGNETTYLKEYKEPITAKIITEEKFEGKKPTYKLIDESNQNENGYIYQIKINDGEWQNINKDTEYTIEEPETGTNTIKTRTIDLLGRISQEAKTEIIYKVKDDTIAKNNLPNTGVATIVLGFVIILVLATVKHIRYKNLRDIH